MNLPRSQWSLKADLPVGFPYRFNSSFCYVSVYGKPFFYHHRFRTCSCFQSNTCDVFELLSKQVNRWTRWRTIQSLMGRDIYFTHSMSSLLCTAYMCSPNQCFILIYLLIHKYIHNYFIIKYRFELYLNFVKVSFRKNSNYNTLIR